MLRSSQAVELSVIKKYNNYYERTKYLLVVIEEKKLVQIEDKEFWLYLSTTYWLVKMVRVWHKVAK